MINQKQIPEMQQMFQKQIQEMQQMLDDLSNIIDNN